jgi:autotransporter translocation and assembly factor TamB
LRAAVALVVLAALSLAGAYLARDRWTPPVASWALARFAKLSFAAERAHWTGLHALELEGVRVAALDGASALREARFESIAVEFDPSHIAREGLRAVHTIDASGARVVLDTSTSHEPSTGKTEVPEQWPRGLPTVHVNGLYLEVRWPEAKSLTLSGASLALEPSGDKASIQLAVSNVEYRTKELSIARPIAIEAAWSAGRLDVTRLDVDPRIDVRHLSIGFRELASGSIDAVAELDLFGGTSEIRAALEKDRASVQVHARALDLASALSLLPGPPADLSARVDLDVHATLPLDGSTNVIEGVRGRALLDAVDVRVAGHAVDWVHADVDAGERNLRVREVFVLQRANQARVTDAVLPRDALDPCAIAEHLTCAFELSLEDVPALLAEAGEPEIDLGPHRASLRGWLVDRALELDGGSFATAGGTLTIERGHVPLDRWRTMASDPELALRMHASFDDVAPLAVLAALPPTSGRLDAAVGIAGGREGLHGWADLQAEDVRVSGQELGAVAAHCDLSNGRWDVEHLTLSGPDAMLDARGSVILGDRVRTAAAPIALENVRVRGWLRDASVLRIDALPRGGIELDLDASGTWPAIDGRVLARARALEAQGFGEVHAEVTARVSRGRIDVDELTLESRYGIVRARGMGGELGALLDRSAEKCLRLDALDWRNGDQSLSLAEPLDVELSARGVYASGLDLSGPSGGVQASFAVDPSASNGRVRASAHGVDPAPWLSRFARTEIHAEHLDLDLDATWDASDVRATAKGRAESLRIGAGPATNVELDCALGNKRASIEKLSVAVVLPATSAVDDGSASDSAQQTPLEFSGEFPLDLRGEELLPDGDIRLKGAFELLDLDRIARTLSLPASKIDGRVRADLDLTGTWRDPRGRVGLDASGLSWTPPASEQTFGPCSVRGEVDLEHDLSIHNLVVDLPAGARVECTGKMTGPFDLRDPLFGRASAWRAAPVDLSVALDASNLSLLTVMIPSLRRLGGRMQGSLTVQGTLAEPRFSGSLELADGEVRTASALASLTGLSAKLVLEGDHVKLDGMRGEMGGAPFSLSGTVSPFGDEPRVDLALDGEHLLLYRASGVRVRADAKLTIAGPLRAMEIGGELMLDGSRFTRNFEFLAVFGKHNPSPPLFSRTLFELPPPFDTAALDVKVGAKTPFVLRNNVVRGGVRPDIKLIGTGALPILRGTIIIDPTRVSLPSGPIYARSGAVEFTPSAPFAPRLDALADARMQGYDVKIHVTGTIEAPVVDLSSVPPLPHEDLALLVLTGTLPRTDQKSPTSVQAAQQVAVYFANDAISNWFSGSEDKPPDKDDSGDWLEVTTGRDVTQSTQSTNESTTARVRVWKGVFSDNSSLYVTGERDIYDRYNYGLRLLFRFP